MNLDSIIASDTVLVVHAAATWFLVGLIWFVQIVHYPLMGKVGAEQWRDYEVSHQKRVTLIVGVMMPLELLAVIWLALGETPRELSWSGLGLLGVIWASTFFVQVPLHARLGANFNIVQHSRLVRTNWVRTVAWSMRGGIAAMMLLTT